MSTASRLQLQEAVTPTENGSVEHFSAELSQYRARLVVSLENSPLGDAAEHQVEHGPPSAPYGSVNLIYGLVDQSRRQKGTCLKVAKKIHDGREGLDAVRLRDNDLDAARSQEGVPGRAVAGTSNPFSRAAAELRNSAEDVAIHVPEHMPRR